MLVEVLGMNHASLRRWCARQQASPAPGPRRRGRPPVISPSVQWRLRACYRRQLGQWGPHVLRCWARREGLGQYSPSTIARVIGDLRPAEPPKKPPRRYEISAPNVMWSEDGAGFRDWGRKRELVVIQDEHSRYKVAYGLSPGPARGEDVRGLLAKAFEEHGAPLVLKRDGGAIFDEAGVMELLEQHQVVVVTSPRHYPPYNGKKERSFRDVRGYDRALRKRCPHLRLGERIDRAMDDLNHTRPRPVLGGHTAEEVYAKSSRALPGNKQFTKEVQRREEELTTQAASRHERDAARRRAVEDVLWSYGLIRWNTDVSHQFSKRSGTF